METMIDSRMMMADFLTALFDKLDMAGVAAMAVWDLELIAEGLGRLLLPRTYRHKLRILHRLEARCELARN